MLPSKKRRSSRLAGYADNEFDISNNAFASAILGDETSEDSSGIHREELVQSIMNHEAAVIDEQEQQQQQEQRHRNLERGLSAKKLAAADIDDYSFRPMTGFVSLPHHEMMKNRGDNSEHTPSTNTRRSSLASSSNGGNLSRYQQQHQRTNNQTTSAKGGLLSTTSIFSSGLSSIKVQVSELDRMFLQHKQGNSYEVPLPQLPHEGKRAYYIRILIACICLATAVTITMLGGQGQFGQASASYLYNNYILGGEMSHDNLVLNDETTKNGSHLFEKVETIEKGFRRNVLGDPEQHLPSLTVHDNGNIEVSVAHEMTEELYIEFIWVKEVASKKVVLARSFSPDKTIVPTLKAKVPSGVKLRPYLFCNQHELWVGEEVEVP